MAMEKMIRMYLLSQPKVYYVRIEDYRIVDNKCHVRYFDSEKSVTSKLVRIDVWDMLGAIVNKIY